MKIDPEYVKKELIRRTSERQLSLVALGCGVNVRTMQRIMAGYTGAKVKTVSALQTYLKNTERLHFLPDARKNGNN
jgi:thiamine kinase-like enzyme